VLLVTILFSLQKKKNTVKIRNYWWNIEKNEGNSIFAMKIMQKLGLSND